MRQIVNRRINREPVRSPSPDIANRSIIRQTVAPLAEIIRQSRIQGGEPRGPTQVNSDSGQSQRVLAEWKQKYDLLENHLNHLLLENSSLKREMHILSELLAKKDQNLASSRGLGLHQSSVKEYESRLGPLMQEIQRIQVLLQQEKQANLLFQHQNKKLRMEATRNAKMIFQEDETLGRLDFIEQTLKGQFERMKAEMQQQVSLHLNTVDSRLMAVEKEKGDLDQIMRRAEYTTPRQPKEGREFEFESTNVGPRSSSPGDSKKFGRKSIPQDDEKKHFQDRLRSQQVEIVRLTEANQDLETSYNSLKGQRAPPAVSEECFKCRIYLNEIARLQSELQQLRQAEDQQGQQGLLKEELERQHESYSLNFEDYLRRIRDIKTSLSGEELREFVAQVGQLTSENKNLNDKLVELLYDREKDRKEARAKEVEQNLLLYSLSRQNEVLKVQISEQDSHIAKLQELIDQRYSQKLSPLEDISSCHDVADIEGEDPGMFQKCIEQAIKKLQNLEESMQTTLRE